MVTFVHTWAFNHLDDVFYFQDACEINGIKVPFTIGIQIPTQLQSMVSLGDHGAISMDVTFGTNDVKFLLFTLMGFDAQHSKMLVTWIITNCQTCNNLVEWLSPLKAKLQGRCQSENLCVSSLMMLHKLRTLWWVYFHSTIFIFMYMQP
jgi:hypothetical protein